MIYLCSVYSLNADENLMQKRYEYAMERTAAFLLQHLPIFSPIVHCHEIAKTYAFPKTWAFWKIIDFGYIDTASAVWVLMMPGWENSVGVSAEILYAKELGKEIVYIDCTGYTE